MTLDDDIKLEDSIDYIDVEYESIKPKILVFGVGGGGVNAVNSMYAGDDLKEVDFVVANTDSQSLKMSPVKNKILLGRESMHGLGAGMDPIVGKNAAEESIDEIEKALTGVNMLFLTAGMGGGTGTGAVSVVAKKAKEMGILVVAIVTKPFISEGNTRMNIAENGIRELKKYIDTLIIVPNQNLFRKANQSTKLQDSLKMVDDVLKYGVKGITDLITKPGFINLDFADVKTIMSKSGRAMMGTGEASGENKAQKAVEEALSNPLLDNVSIKGARGIIINVTGSPDITLFEYDNATKKIKEEVDNDDAYIMVGNVFDKTLEDTVRISIFATGIEDPDDNINYNMKNEYSIENNNIFDVDENNNELYSENYIEKIYDENKYKENYSNKNLDNDYVKNDYIKDKKEANAKQIRKRIGDFEEDNDFFDMGNTDIYDETLQRTKQKPKKEETKHGFFSSLFGGSEKKQIVNKIEENDFDINMEYYNNTPAYLRKKNK